MGLDMYMSVRKYVSKIEKFKADGDHEINPEFDSVVESAGLTDITRDATTAYTGAYVEAPVMYWRKANAIHKWIVDNCADGVDKCQQIYVSREKLTDLWRTAFRVTENPELASELLPTESGFFFGPTEYDEYYYRNVEETFQELSKLKDNLDKPENDDLDVIYQASW